MCVSGYWWNEDISMTVSWSWNTETHDVDVIDICMLLRKSREWAVGRIGWRDEEEIRSDSWWLSCKLNCAFNILHKKNISFQCLRGSGLLKWGFCLWEVGDSRFHGDANSACFFEIKEFIVLWIILYISELKTWVRKEHLLKLSCRNYLFWIYLNILDHWWELI